MVISFFNFFLNFYLFLRERERERVCSGQGVEREGDTESEAVSIWAQSCQQRAQCGA